MGPRSNEQGRGEVWVARSTEMHFGGGESLEALGGGQRTGRRSCCAPFLDGKRRPDSCRYANCTAGIRERRLTVVVDEESECGG